MELAPRITGWSKTAFTAEPSAFAPSMTTRIGRVTRGPGRAGRPRSSFTTVAFSVSPSTTPSGCLTPAMSMPIATTHVIGEVDAVDHEGDEIELGQVGRDQLGQGVLGRADEAPGDGDFDVPRDAASTAVPTGSRPAR